jgi:hypothetical protein
MVLQAGDKFPEGVKFGWAPIMDEDPTVCGIPQLYDANKEWAGKILTIITRCFHPQLLRLPPPSLRPKVPRTQVQGRRHCRLHLQQ